MPGYQSVPDTWKSPLGPYRQAPPEFGGLWWSVSPFTGEEPWKTQTTASMPFVTLPDGFVIIYGPEPTMASHGAGMWVAARNKWLQDLIGFVNASRPEWASDPLIKAAGERYRAYNMGGMLFFTGRYGPTVRFTGTRIKDFESSAREALFYPEMVIANYQVQELQADPQMVPAVRHWLVPPQFWPDYKPSEHGMVGP